MDVDQLRKFLIRAVTRNNVNGARFFLKHIKKHGLGATDSTMCDQVTRANIFQIALLNNCWDVSRYLLIACKEDNLFTDLCEANNAFPSSTNQGLLK